jgi:hypothetical protein
MSKKRKSICPDELRLVIVELRQELMLEDDGPSRTVREKAARPAEGEADNRREGAQRHQDGAETALAGLGELVCLSTQET